MLARYSYGSFLSVHRGYDLVGVCLLAFVGSVGGGLKRDAIFLQQIPVVMQHAEYLWTILIAVLVAMLTFRYAERFANWFAYVDALSLGVYGIYGANRALIAGLSPEGALLVGVCNAVGGGLLRDILVREEPILFKPGQFYALAGLAGCIAYVYFSYEYGMETERAAWIGIGVAVAVRMLAIRFNLTTKPVRVWLKVPEKPGA